MTTANPNPFQRQAATERCTYGHDETTIRAMGTRTLYFRNRDRPLARLVLVPARSERIASLYEEARAIVESTFCIPKVLCHNNAHQKNLFPLGPNEPIVGIDWAGVGVERPGTDATYALVSAVRWGEPSAENAKRLFAPVTDAGLDGLMESGWSGDHRSIPIVGHLVCGQAEAITIACITGRVIEQPAEREWVEQASNASLEEAFHRLQPAMDLAIHHADRAIELVNEIGL